jgi:hypothetical protein|tara:strand:- start:187 stop:423 length:237 start_codon:yes stop_codon:yes gene_type:complete
MIYFITVLVMLNIQPSLGWIQYTYSYTDKELCEKYVEEFKDTLSLSIGNHFKDKMVSIQKFECITRDEAVERNSKLGH